MTALSHALVAAAIAGKIHNIYLDSILAVCSHFVLDSIPHWDFGTNWKFRPKWVTGTISISETLIGITVAYFLFIGKAQPVPLLVTIILSIIPDWLEAPWYIFFANKNKTKPSKTAGNFEKFCYGIYKFENRFHNKAGFPLGVITQIATVGLFIIILR
jgi:hypothetical protein